MNKSATAISGDAIITLRYDPDLWELRLVEANVTCPGGTEEFFLGTDVSMPLDSQDEIESLMDLAIEEAKHNGLGFTAQLTGFAFPKYLITITEPPGMIVSVKP